MKVLATHRAALALLLVIAWAEQLPAAVVAKDGKAKAVIGVSDTAGEFEKLAAKELAGTLQKICGSPFEQVSVAAADAPAFIKKTKAAGQTSILIGSLAERGLAKKLGDLPRGALVLQVDDDTVRITGVEEGVYYSAIELLEQLGCRWFMPGDLGEVTPELATINVKAQQTVQAPSFPSRWFQMPDKDRQMKVRCGGVAFPGGHGLPAPKVKVDKATGEITPAEDAEYFALVKGKRTTRQHCLSNPKLLEYAIAEVKKSRAAGRGPTIGMGPNDGAGFCECDDCKALDGGDFDPFSNENSVTDRYVWFFNQVLKGVEKDYPDTKIAFYIYHSYMRPPLKHQLDPRITGALAPIALDRVHGFSNPIAPEKSYARWLYQEWGKIMPELYDRGYWSNLACPGFPFVIVHRLRDEIPECHKLGLKGWRVETFPNYGTKFPSMYIAGKLMWNHEADVDALMEDCFQKFFGPAAEPMGQYITLMDHALRDSDHATGCSWDMPFHYPAPLRDQARKLVEQGAKLASGQGIYERRVKMITQTLDMLDAFIAMLDARVQVDFIRAQRELEKLDAVAGELMAYQPTPMLSAGRFSTYVNYMKRFYRPCTEQGYKRVTGGNQLIAAAADEWDFQIDPARVGEDIGFWREDITGGMWQRIKSSSSSWSNQGLRYYKGLAWYRQTIDVPKDAAGKRIFFWCGGVDESAKVWLNGKPLGISHGATFYPFELDATEAVKPGEKNSLVVCVANLVVNELGTGGIVGPVMLYAPAEGKEAKLENVKELKPTFP